MAICGRQVHIGSCDLRVFLPLWVVDIQRPIGTVAKAATMTNVDDLFKVSKLLLLFVWLETEMYRNR